jgi:hypothetical protein
MTVTRRGLKLPESLDYQSMGVKAGVLENATYPPLMVRNAKTGKDFPDPRAGMHVATIAASLEYGTSKAPARPFMQTTVAAHRQEWVDGVVTLLTNGMSLSEAFMTIGQVMKEDIQHTINSWPADNKEDWAEVKGFNKGLIWTSHLLKSIESEVIDDNGDPLGLFK